MIKSGLVLEGGALRSFYTMGVLDAFLDENLNFEYVCGVSGGALCAMNYLSRQVGRTVAINMNFLEDKRYKSMMNIVKRKPVFHLDFLFSQVVEDFIPFDYQRYYESEQRFELAATDCGSGEAVFFPKPDRAHFDQVVASASIPFASKMIELDGRDYLDGGLSMPIPYQQTLDQGYERIVIILTREKDYRKQTINQIMRRIIHAVYGKYPALCQAMIDRPEMYNQMKTTIEQYVREGKMYIIEPQQPVIVSRFETDKSKLMMLYHQGYNETIAQIENLKHYLTIRK